MAKSGSLYYLVDDVMWGCVHMWGVTGVCTYVG